MNRIIIESSRNVTPEKDIQARIDALGEGWEIVSANTSLVTHGSWPNDSRMATSPLHVMYVTTVTLKKEHSFTQEDRDNFLRSLEWNNVVAESDGLEVGRVRLEPRPIGEDL